MMGWHECEGWCGTNPACAMARYAKDTHLCYAYSSTSTEDADGNGGSNYNWVSATCHQDDDNVFVPSKFPSNDCFMETPKSGDAPGGPLVAHSMEPYYEDCRCLCLASWNCSSVIYRESTGDCMLLSKEYNRYYTKAAFGDDAVVANRVCSGGWEGCPYQYYMLEVAEVNTMSENSWCVAELVFLDGDLKKIEVPFKRNNVFLLEGRPEVAASMFSYNTEALSAFDEDVATAVVTDQSYNSGDGAVGSGRYRDETNMLAAKLVVDLGAPKAVREIRMTSCSEHYGRHPKVFRIKASPDTTSWADLFENEEEIFEVGGSGFGKEFVAKTSCTDLC